MRIAEYKKRLVAEQEKLESELGSIGRKNPANPADWEPKPPPSETEPDLIDSADITIGFDTNASIVADLEKRYDEVLAALERIENGTYGTCKVSGEPIEEERLNADPAARTCRTHLNQ